MKALRAPSAAVCGATGCRVKRGLRRVNTADYGVRVLCPACARALGRRSTKLRGNHR